MQKLISVRSYFMIQPENDMFAFLLCIYPFMFHDGMSILGKIQFLFQFLEMFYSNSCLFFLCASLLESP